MYSITVLDFSADAFDKAFFNYYDGVLVMLMFSYFCVSLVVEPDEANEYI